MSITAEEHLNLFIKALLKENALYSDVKKLLTKTQQESCKFIKLYTVESSLSGLYSILKRCDKITIKEKFSTVPFIKDCIITGTSKIGKVKIQCKLIKEITVRKPDKNGVWGVNASSFTYLHIDKTL